MSEHHAHDDDRTEASPRATPAYADPEMRELGERLAALYQAREAEPGSSALVDEIASVRAKMRRGARLAAGEFLQDGRYRLLSRDAGHGGVDEQWFAWDRRTKERVSVRVYRGDWIDDPRAVDAFRARGQLLRKLGHRNIGQVLDADRSDDGFVFLVTRVVGEATLADTRLDPTDAVQVGIELAQALEHAHQHGVVHGGVRPDAVRLDGDGHPWLVGFGVEADPRADLASLYRAPESAERGYQPKPAADVYALGMTLLAALNGGELPFWVLRDPGRLIRAVPTSDAIRTILARATDWDLAARYPDVGAMVADLVADGALLEELASRARARGRAATAAGHYESLLRLRPQRAVELRTLLGRLYADLGAWDLAFQHLLAALEKTPDVESLFDPLRAVAARTGDWSRLAQALWTQARARDPGRRVILRTELARINQQELGNAVAAAETWSQVLADHRMPQQATTALRALQEIARSRGDWKGFVEFGQELLAYVDGEEKSRVDYAIGRAYLEHLGDEERGLQFIDRAEAAGYSEVDLGARLQLLRAQRGQWQRVIQLMIQQAAAQEISEASPTLLRAGIIATSVHLEDEALAVYRALLERAPRHVVALRHLARMHHRAHEHANALPFYERLWETYRGKESEEPEASERAADCTAYARLLIDGGRLAEAVERLDEALRLNPNHVPALELAGPLFAVRGEIARAGQVFDRLLALFKSVELSPQKVAACLGMGELAWAQGRLVASMGWFNRAIELDPFTVTGWWGLAKVALAARAGHPGADRAPWITAMPRRATGHEALARLLAGVVQPASMRTWLGRSAMGRSFLEDGDQASPVRLAAAVVDVLARHDLLSPDLFRRLGDACPEWAEPIDEVHRLVLGDGAASFPIVRTYHWLRHCMAGRPFTDFPDLEARTVLPMDATAPTVGGDRLDDAESWHVLLSGQRPAPPVPFTMIEHASEASSPALPGPVGALVRDGATWAVLRSTAREFVVGSGREVDLSLAEDPTVRPRHLRVFRVGPRVYVEAEPGARLQIDGDDRRLWRLVGGERVTIGETRLQWQHFEDESRLPPAAVRSVATGSAADAPAPASEADEPLALPEAPETPERVTPAPDALPAAPRPLAAAAESTGPLESPLPLPARSHEPAVTSEPIPMPDDVIGAPPTGPLAPVALLRDAPADDEPESIEVRIDDRPAPPARTADADLPEIEEVDAKAAPPASQDADTTRVDPAEVAAAQAVASLGPDASSDEVPFGAPAAADDDDDEEKTAARVGPPVRPPPTPVPLDRHAAPAGGDDAEEEGAPPSWLREALAAEARRAATPKPPERAAAPAPSVAPPAPAEPVTQPLPTASAGERVTLPIVLPAPAPLTVERVTQPLQPALRASLPPGFAAPVVAAVVPPAPPRPASEPPKPAPESPWTSSAPPKAATEPEGFGFGDEFIMDDPSELSAPARSLPIGVVGPSTPVPPARKPSTTSTPTPLPSTKKPAAASTPTPPPPARKPPATSTPTPPPTLQPPVAPPPAASAPPVASTPIPAAPPSVAPASATSPAAQPSPASLEFLFGPDRGRRVPVSDLVTIGAAAECQISLPTDPRLSPIHCRVERVDQAYRLRDEQSGTGTVVNGKRVTEVELRGGDVIMVGRTALRFNLESAG